MRSVLHLVLAASLFPAIACAYSLVRYQAGDQAGRSVSVRTLANNSAEPGIEILMTEALRREVMRRGGLRLIADSDSADIVIRGGVRPLSTSSKSFSTVVLALEYTVTLAVDLQIEQRGEEAIEFTGSPFRDSEIYLASADVEAGRKNREEALRRLAELIAGRVHDALDREL